MEKGFNMSRLELDGIAKTLNVGMRASTLSLSEIIAYMTAVLGVLGDQFSTRLGLSVPGIVESNHFTAMLIESGLWLPFDILVLAFAVGLPALLIRYTKMDGIRFSLSFPLLFGAARLLATAWNLRLFLLGI